MQEDTEMKTSSLLWKEKQKEDDNGECSGDGTSSVTFMLIFSTFICAVGSFLSGNAMGFSSPAESGILDELGLSLTEYSLFGSISTVGSLLGAVLCGKITDVIGRRGGLWVSDAFCIVGWLAIAFSKGVWSLDVGRLSVGIGTGILSYVTPTYIAEITPQNLRGACAALSMLMTGFGISLVFIIGSICHWRILALLGVIPCLLQLLGIFLIPESPRWLANAGQEKELEFALQLLRGKNVDISYEVAEITDYMQSLQYQKAEAGIMELFQRKYSYAILVGVGLVALQQFGGLSAYTSYMSFILESAGFSSAIGSAITSIAQLVMNISSIFLIDRYGRRPLLLVSSSGMCLGSLTTGVSFLLKSSHMGKETSPVLALIGVVVCVSSISIGLGGIPWIIIAEVIPVNVKGSAGSILNLLNSSSNWIVVYTFNFLFVWSSAGVFFIYSAICGLGIIFVAKLVPETKGRKLEEIQASIIID
ncbi:putative sugar transporter ERD6-like 13 isoform X2 [Manihot esculenta]|uniref:Major facilitator superfamily (MFS) profile domain-containing protein n=1 Tax=Manihot esculenta TaxID=3983 RepID=A0A2C9VFT6_MANES|nr:putative sugar transporter ERD6-like 13 isoform X2 [Manihot esculenta]OAY44120.1 hypothetical protein MANES_08G124300v8 [Manihot esculenta]